MARLCKKSIRKVFFSRQPQARSWLIRSMRNWGTRSKHSQLKIWSGSDSKVLRFLFLESSPVDVFKGGGNMVDGETAGITDFILVQPSVMVNMTGTKGFFQAVHQLLHWCDWVEGGLSFPLPGEHHHVRCQVREGSWQLAGKACSAFGKLYKCERFNKHLKNDTKISVCVCVCVREREKNRN